MPSLERSTDLPSPPGAVVIGRNSALLIGGNLIARFAALLTTIVIVRRLPTQDFAVIVLAQAAVAYLAIAIDFGLTLAGIRDVARNRDHASFTMGSVIASRGIIGVLGFPIIVLGALVFPFSGEMRVVVVLFAVATTMSVFDLSWVLQGIEEMRLRAVVLAGTSILNLGLVAIFLIVAPSPTVIPLAQILATGALLTIAATVVLKRIGRPRWSGRKSLVVLVGSAVPLGVGSLAAQVYYNVDLLLLGVMRTQQEVATYGAVYKIILALLMLAGMYGVVFLPRYAAAHARADGSLERILRLNVRLLASFALPVAVGGTAFAKPLVNFVFGQEYELGAEPLAILLWSVLVAFVSSTLVYALVASGRGWLVTAAAVCAAGLNVALNLVLIPPLGMNGAAVSTVAAEVVVLFVVLARSHLVSWVTLRDLGRLAPSAGVMVITLVATSGIPVPLGVALGSGAYVLAAFVTGVWTRADRAVLRGALEYVTRVLPHK